MNVAFSARVQAFGNYFEYASIGETMDLHLTVIGTPVIEIAYSAICKLFEIVLNLFEYKSVFKCTLYRSKTTTTCLHKD